MTYPQLSLPRFARKVEKNCLNANIKSFYLLLSLLDPDFVFNVYVSQFPISPAVTELDVRVSVSLSLTWL